MSVLVRFGVSIDDDLLKRFDGYIKEKDYPTRSKAISDLISACLVEQDCIKGDEVAGTITLVYDHHRRELVNRLTDIQHDYHHIVLSSQHIHLDHHNCLEVIIAKGKSDEIEKLTQKLKATKGVKHSALTMAGTK
ncbi:MAG: nickel-responsive transcriptional regulator NikR [Endomicrobiales bacterium]|nr:nickel-responsive transcriptional regulator NikR [Endomicrobiales bacterium]